MKQLFKGINVFIYHRTKEESQQDERTTSSKNSSSSQSRKKQEQCWFPKPKNCLFPGTPTIQELEATIAHSLEQSPIDWSVPMKNWEPLWWSLRWSQQGKGWIQQDWSPPDWPRMECWGWENIPHSKPPAMLMTMKLSPIDCRGCCWRSMRSLTGRGRHRWDQIGTQEHRQQWKSCRICWERTDNLHCRRYLNYYWKQNWMRRKDHRRNWPMMFHFPHTLLQIKKENESNSIMKAVQWIAMGE